jgi:outer membrane lipoprotein-sorting protein
MRKLLAILLAFAQVAHAQSSHEAAKKWLEEASQTLKEQRTVDIGFTYTFSNERVNPPVKRSEKGELQLKGDAYRLVLMGSEQICDGKMVYTILHEDEEVQKAPAQSDNPEEESFHPMQVLELYKKNFSYKLGGKETVKGQEVQYIVLMPNASEQLQRVVVGIYTKSKQLYSYEQQGTDGTVTRFVVDTYSANTSLPAHYFQFDPKRFPGYYIPR